MIVFVLRAALILGLALLSMPLLRRAPAAARRSLLLVALAASLVVPVASAMVPARAHANLVPVPEPARAFAEAAEEVAVPVAATRSAPAPLRFPWERALLAVWGAGVAVLLLRTAGAHLRARRLGRGEIALADVEVPAVVGIFAPTILLPRASRQWSAERLDAVLRHERAHIAHRDGLAQLVAQIACAVYWFNPLVWVAARRLRRECELAADARVVASGMVRSDYAEHLLAVAAGLIAPAASLGMASELEERTRALFRSPARPWSRARLLGLWLAGGVMVGVLACSGAKPPATAMQGSETIDARVQAIAVEEAARAKSEWAAADVSIVVLDPATAQVLAMTGGAQVARVTGSTMKPFTVAAALEAKRLDPSDSFDCEQGKRAYGGKTLTDGSPHGTLDVRQILAVSSNVCTSKIFDRLGGTKLIEMFRALRFSGVPERVEDGSFEGALVAAGEGTKATPLELAAAYAALMDGTYRAPSLTRSPSRAERVMTEATARTVRAMLEEVVHGPLGTGKRAAVPGHRVAGKTGTAEIGEDRTFASFAGFFPADRPRYIIYIGVEAPRGGEAAPKVAAPVFARVASRL